MFDACIPPPRCPQSYVGSLNWHLVIKPLRTPDLNGWREMYNCNFNHHHHIKTACTEQSNLIITQKNNPKYPPSTPNPHLPHRAFSFSCTMFYNTHTLVPVQNMIGLVFSGSAVIKQTIGFLEVAVDMCHVTAFSGVTQFFLRLLFQIPQLLVSV